MRNDVARLVETTCEHAARADAAEWNLISPWVLSDAETTLRNFLEQLAPWEKSVLLATYWLGSGEMTRYSLAVRRAAAFRPAEAGRYLAIQPQLCLNLRKGLLRFSDLAERQHAAVTRAVAICAKSASAQQRTRATCEWTKATRKQSAELLRGYARAS